MTTSHALIFAPLLLLFGCGNGRSSGTGDTLPAKAFRQKMAELPTAPLLDVRTPEEYAKGHLAHALNWNWTDGEFKQKVADLDPAKPVFVYCLSGGRSAQAADLLRSNGFQQVYELKGGIMKWNAADLPIEMPDGAAASAGMSKAEFEALYNTDKTVLVDFYADWCAPCKRMKPYLDEIGKDMADKVTVVRINADENPALCKELGVDALPVLHVYKDRQLTWRNTGYIAKDAVVEQL
jgi:thioredoxin